ncbi:MAG TPA: glycosyltransferase family 2 protein [Chitinophagaceae bacterium]|nr:glycosyltransferase family 2 protein [Chitinophagaceae bacterium]
MQFILPLVTIGIPTYNQQQYLAEALKSALAQTYPNLEVIVADDCSTDSTQNLVHGYLSDKRIKYFRNENNIGRVLNYRKLFYEYAAGNWYVNLDGDDYYIDDNFITSGIEKINSFQARGYEIMFYHSGLKTIIKDQTTTYVPNIEDEVVLISGKTYFENFFSLNASSHLTIICNRLKALTIDYYSKNAIFTDVHSFVRLALHGHVILDKKISAVWRVHSENASHLLEEQLKNEIEVKHDISNYAIPFVGEEKAVKWFSKAKAELINNLIYKNVQSDAVYSSDWMRFFKHFRFSVFFTKHFLKYIFLSVKNYKHFFPGKYFGMLFKKIFSSLLL